MPGTTRVQDYLDELHHHQRPEWAVLVFPATSNLFIRTFLTQAPAGLVIDIIHVNRCFFVLVSLRVLNSVEQLRVRSFRRYLYHRMLAFERGGFSL